MGKNMLYKLSTVVFLVAPLVFLAVNYNQLPAEVPLHFGLDGKADRFGNKSELWLAVFVMQAVATGTFFMLINLHKIDPKKHAKTSRGAMQKIALGVVILISIISVIIIYSAAAGRFAFGGFFLPLVGLFFSFLGNIMYSVKPNYFVGIRTPWALEDEDNWRKTHQLAGKLWFAGGLAIALLTLLLPMRWGLISLFVVAFVITAVPVVYSYLYFKKNKKV